MRRDEFVQFMANAYKQLSVIRPTPEQLMDMLLKAMEEKGIKPPALSSDKCQAIMDVYYAGYTFNQWDEDFEKDEKANVALKRRKEAEKKRRDKREKK